MTVLTTLLWAAYWPVLRNDFLRYDDQKYVTGNPHVLTGLTWVNAGWAFHTLYAANWHPLTWLSHMADVQLFGLKPEWHHLTSLLLHLANSLLLFLFAAPDRPGMAELFCGRLFAAHPCMWNPSPGWPSERMC